MKDINAEYVNSKDHFQVIKLLGSVTLCYGKPASKKWRGIAFKDGEIATAVAIQILKASFIDTNQDKILEILNKAKAQ